MTVIAAAEYRPDVANLNTAYSSDIRNVFPADGSYVPANSFSPTADALEAKPLGAITVISTNGTVRIFAGTGEKLWLLNNTTMAFDDVSQTSVTYGATDAAPWSFAVFGDFVIAVNQNDDPQVYEIGTDTEFRDLGGSPPRAGIVKVWGDFVVLMRLTSNPERAQWSGLNDCEFWTPGSNNSDYQDFPDGGIVQGSSEVTNPIIFLQRAIYKATFIPGSVEIFSFQKIHERRGAISSKSIATRGAFAFYADEGGFFQISPDGQIVPIGFEKVDRTVFEQLSSSALSDIRGVVDPFQNRVYWAADFGGDGQFSQIYAYDWALSKWTRLDAAVIDLFPVATTGTTLEGLDALYATLEDVPFSLDSRVWKGGSHVLGAFNASYELGYFSGEAMEATITTQEFGEVSGPVQRMSQVVPIVDTAEAVMSVAGRMRRSDGISYSAEREQSSNTGIVRIRSRARFHRFKTRIPAGTTWTHFQGVDASFTEAGMR